ncbi:liprin-alpha-2-like [Erinaceus europaeus]|uniref:Liprin-alpha-2-like n=1 Tax=Erinaceus europaeus TaxID=9365 RepID=A0ABM3YJ07_ERIEU|nr:liprin-alpha-2-like [Erinaceus europaeus]
MINATLTKLINAYKELHSEQEEERELLVIEFKNIKTLREHLEYLVSLHESSLRNTVMRRRVQPIRVCTPAMIQRAIQEMNEVHATLQAKLSSAPSRQWTVSLGWGSGSLSNRNFH